MRLIATAQGSGAIGFVLVVLGCAAAAAVAAGLVRRVSPEASGSGIPHAEAALRGEVPPARLILAPVKFVGGVLAIGSGLALGREGPTVQMGATAATAIGQMAGLPWRDVRALLAAGAGAGLATAFNAPLSGAAFVLEELVQSFDQRIAVAGLAAAATAIAVMRVLIGDTPDFQVAALPDISAAGRACCFAMGAVMGFVGIAYNRAILGATAAVGRIPLPVEARAGLIGGAVGAVAFVYPWLVGGGDTLTRATLMGAVDIHVLPLVFLARFVLAAASYATGTPGGLFAPLLTLGAEAGFLFGAACLFLFPDLGVAPQAFALVGMAALFTAAVRSPLTGMVLVSEMTGNVTMLLPMLGACALAMLVPKLLGEPPIYDSLRESLLRARAAQADRQPPSR